MPLVAKCDVCGLNARRNAAETGLTSKRGDLVVFSKVMKANGSDPILCEKCVRLAVTHGESAGEPAA